jgi:phospholipase C
MQENRSFDHYFGTLPGVRGFADPAAIKLSTGRPVFYQPDPQNPDGYLLPYHLDTHTTNAQAIPSTSHAWAVQHSAWDSGKMDNWLPAHLAADGKNGPFTMGYYEREDIPFQFALAESFTICDNYHCSVLGPTWPNRLYHMSATIDPLGQNGGPIISNVDPTPYTWKTYPEALTDAGVSWQVYQEVDNYSCNLLEMFASFQNAPVNSIPRGQHLRRLARRRGGHAGWRDRVRGAGRPVLRHRGRRQHRRRDPGAGRSLPSGRGGLPGREAGVRDRHRR